MSTIEGNEVHPVTNEQVKAVRQVLRNFNNPVRIDSIFWQSFCVITEQRQERPDSSVYQAMRRVFDGVLAGLEAESPIYADLLRGRFWEGLSVNAMLSRHRPEYMGERTFNDRQNQAIRRFAMLLYEQEDACRTRLATNQKHIVTETEAPILPELSDEDANEQPEEAEELEARTRPFSRVRWYIAALVLIIVVGVVATAAVLNRNPPQTVAQSSTSIPTLAIATSAPSQAQATLNETVCANSSPVVAPNVPRFVRSEGVSNFTIENTGNGVLTNKVRTLAIDSRGLWIGYLTGPEQKIGGLGQYDKQQWTNCNQASDLLEKNVNALLALTDGTLWVATENDGVAHFDGQTWHRFTKQDGLPSDKTYSVAVDAAGHVWVGTWEGVATFDGAHWSTPYSAENGSLVNDHVIAVAPESDGSLWVGYIKNGLSYYNAQTKQWSHFAAGGEDLSGNQVRSILLRPATADAPASVWIATEDGGISVYQQGKWLRYNTENGLSSNAVRTLTTDRYNRVWAATAKGVVYFDGKSWTRYTTFDSVAIAIGSSCQKCPFDDDHVWTGTAVRGLTHSRLPLRGDVLDVVKVTYPDVVAPGETFRPEIVVKPHSPYQLRQDRGDFLSNTDSSDDNLFGAYPLIPVKGIISDTLDFTFTDYDNPFKAPELAPDEEERTFTSTWRVWMFTRYVGPPIQITFTVRRAKVTPTATR